jgi:hypothetical protein
VVDNKTIIGKRGLRRRKGTRWVWKYIPGYKTTFLGMNILPGYKTYYEKPASWAHPTNRHHCLKYFKVFFHQKKISNTSNRAERAQNFTSYNLMVKNYNCSVFDGSIPEATPENEDVRNLHEGYETEVQCYKHFTRGHFLQIRP